MADQDIETPTTTGTDGPDVPMNPADADRWRGYIAASERRRKDLLTDWAGNVDFRVMRPFGGTFTDPDTAQSDRVAVPEDWARTKQKTAQLSFQIPKIIAKARRPEFLGSERLVTAAVNTALATDCRASYVIDEVLADVINAAGLMVTFVGVDRRTEDRVVRGPDGQPMPGPAGQPATVTRLVSQRYTLDRISPSLFLWPQEFTLSDWDKAPWLGFQTWMPLAQAKREFKLPPDFKSVGSKPELLTKDLIGRFEIKNPQDYVKVTQLWYYAAQYDEKVSHPDHIRRIVFVEGHTAPVVHEDTDWQTWVEETPDVPAVPPQMGPDGQPMGPGQPAQKGSPGHYLGLTKLPIRVGTLTYVSDLATPPSDTGAARAQVKELIRSRSQMLRNRDHSLPIRWYDVNRIDEMVIERMRQGTWQDIIPVNGPGERAIGEVARANFPRENFEFQRVITGDLDRAWSLASPQLGTTTATERSATEINAMQGATDVRLDYEKARVGRYICEIAEVLFSLMQRWQDFSTYVPMLGPDGTDLLAEVNQSKIAGDYMFEVKADTSDRVDINTKQASALKMFNLLGQSPTVNRMALEQEIFSLHGMDYEKFKVEPKEPPKDPANVSYRFSGAADLMNPLVMAVMLQSGLDLRPEAIEAAKKAIADAMAGPGLDMAQAAAMASGKPAEGSLDPAASMARAEVAAGPAAPAPGGGPTNGIPIEPPPANEPILKRSESGERGLV